jgi:hypothetical protein
MEGFFNNLLNLIIIQKIYISGIKINTKKFSSKTVRKTDSQDQKVKTLLIWVYDIRDSSLIKKAPFSSKTTCALALKINRSIVIAYLDKEKLFNNKWIWKS